MRSERSAPRAVSGVAMRSLMGVLTHPVSSLVAVAGLVAVVLAHSSPASATLVVDVDDDVAAQVEPAGDGDQRPSCTLVLLAGCRTVGSAASVEPTATENTVVPSSSAVPSSATPSVQSAEVTSIDPWQQGGLATNFGTDSIPLHHYQIGADTSGRLGVPDPVDTFVASQTNWVFTAATFLVVFATNALDWAFEFDVAHSLVGEAGILAQRFTFDLFGFGLPTSLYQLALTLSLLVAAFHAVTRSVLTAGVQVGQTFVAYVIVIVLAAGSGFGSVGLNVARLTSDLSRTVAVFGTGDEQQATCADIIDGDRTGPEVAGLTASTNDLTDEQRAQALANRDLPAACSFGHALQRSLIELPYQNLQWGQVLDGVDGKEACARINLELLAAKPWGNDDEPRNRMSAVPECKPNADFNRQATAIRLGIALSTLVTTALVTVLVLVVAAMLLWQQVKLLFLTVLLPHALVFAMLPGQSRTLAWRWAEQLAGVLVRTLALAIGLVVWLSLFSLVVFEQLSVQGTFVSLFASATMAIAGFYGLYRMSGTLGLFLPRLAPRFVGGQTGTGRSARNRQPEPARSVPAAVRVAATTARGTAGGATAALRTLHRNRTRHAGAGLDPEMVRR